MHRALGGHELAAAVRNDGSFCTVLLVGADYNVELTSDRLLPALGRVVADEPLLGSMVFGNDDEGYTLHKLDHVDLSNVVRFYPKLSRDDVVDTVLYTLFPVYNQTKLSLWRAFVFNQGHTLLFALDSTALDGNSGVMIHQRLLAELNLPQAESPGFDISPLSEYRVFRGRSINSIVPSSAKDLPPPLDRAIDLQPDPWGLMYGTASKVDQRLSYTTLARHEPDVSGTGLEYIVRAGDRCTMRFVEIDAQIVNQLRQICRNQGLTMQGLVTAAYVKAHVDCHMAAGSRTSRVNFRVGHCLGCRRFMDTELQTTMGNYFMMFHHHVDLVAEEFNMLLYAHEFTPIQRAMVLPKDKDPTKFISWSGVSNLSMDEHRAMHQNSFDRHPRRHVTAVNLGLVKPLTEGAVTIDKMWFATPPRPGTSKSLIGFMTLDGGPLVVSMATMRISADIAEAEARWFERNLHDLVRLCG